MYFVILEIRKLSPACRIILWELDEWVFKLWDLLIFIVLFLCSKCFSFSCTYNPVDEQSICQMKYGCYNDKNKTEKVIKFLSPRYKCSRSLFFNLFNNINRFLVYIIYSHTKNYIDHIHHPYHNTIIIK